MHARWRQPQPHTYVIIEAHDVGDSWQIQRVVGRGGLEARLVQKLAAGPNSMAGRHGMAGRQRLGAARPQDWRRQRRVGTTMPATRSPLPADSRGARPRS